MSGCCNEMGCRRKKPPMLMRSDLTNTWYVVTAYTERPGEGEYRATTKHRLPDNQQHQLNDMLAAFQDRSEAPVAPSAGLGAPDGGDAA